jgi:hypothetical protein
MTEKRSSALYGILRAGTAVLLVSLSLAALSCAEPFTLEELVDGSVETRVPVQDGNPLFISPSSISLYVVQSIGFTAFGGTPPYVFSVSDNNSGAPAMAGSVYVAGPSSGADTVTVTDDAGNEAFAVVTVSPVPLSSLVDYAVGTAGSLTGSFLAGEAVDGEFMLTNGGDADGVFAVEWIVYASGNTVLGPNDSVVASGSTESLPSLASAAVLFSGFWPANAGDYFLIVEISALDDDELANNQSRTATQTTVN